MEKQTVIKDGIVIDKGIVLTAENVETNKEVYEKWLQHWMMYPDLFLDLIHDDEADPNFHLLPYQRIYLRSIARYNFVSSTATRATSKSFSSKNFAR